MTAGQTIPWNLDSQPVDAEMAPVDDKAGIGDWCCAQLSGLHVARVMEKNGFLTTSEYGHFLKDGLVQ